MLSWIETIPIKNKEEIAGIIKGLEKKYKTTFEQKEDPEVIVFSSKGYAEHEGKKVNLYVEYTSDALKVSLIGPSDPLDTDKRMDKVIEDVINDKK